MKILFILIFILQFLNITAQKNPTYNTTINKADNVEIKDGVINIKRADSVIIKIYITENKYKIYVDDFKQYKDTSGIYITYIHFINPDIINYEVDLVFRFNKPIIDAKLSLKAGSLNINSLGSSNMRSYIGKIASMNGFFEIIKSKEIIQVSINGVYGLLPK